MPSAADRRAADRRGDGRTGRAGARLSRPPRKRHRLPGPPAWLRLAACLAAAGALAGCTASPGGAPGARPGQGPAGVPVKIGGGGVISSRGGGVAQVVISGPGGGFLALPAAPGSSGRPKITLPAVPPASSTKPITLPLDAYSSVSELQQTVLTEASTLLTQQCMAARGFVYTTQATPSQEDAFAQAIEYGFGLTSLPDARTYGYGHPKTPGGPPQGHAFLGGFATFGDLARQPPAWTLALLGFAPGARIGRSQDQGCLIRTSRELFSASGRPASPVPGMAIQASQWTQSDPHVSAVDAAWSRCMARRGYKYRNPRQATGRGWPSTPTALEIATATADVQCKQQVNLPNTWLTVEAAYQAALISQNLPTLAHLQASFSHMLTRAEALLRAGS